MRVTHDVWMNSRNDGIQVESFIVLELLSTCGCLFIDSHIHYCTSLDSFIMIQDWMDDPNVDLYLGCNRINLAYEMVINRVL